MSTQVQETVNEKRLVEASLRGDHRAFEQIYAKYNSKIFSLAYYMCRDRETAKDLTQQIFLKVFTSIRTFDFAAKFSTWLMRLAVNHCIDFLRKKGKVKFQTLDNLNMTMSTSPEHDLHKTEITQALEKAILKMNRKLREVIVLKYIGDLSYSEISETLGCSIGTVGSRLNRGHKFLAGELKDFKEQT